MSLDEEEKKARQKSEAIDRMLEAEGREEENVVKILLLGKHGVCVCVCVCVCVYYTHCVV